MYSPLLSFLPRCSTRSSKGTVAWERLLVAADAAFTKTIISAAGTTAAAPLVLPSGSFLDEYFSITDVAPGATIVTSDSPLTVGGFVVEGTAMIDQMTLILRRVTVVGFIILGNRSGIGFNDSTIVFTDVVVLRLGHVPTSLLPSYPADSADTSGVFGVTLVELRHSSFVWNATAAPPMSNPSESATNGDLQPSTAPLLGSVGPWPSNGIEGPAATFAPILSGTDGTGFAARFITSSTILLHGVQFRLSPTTVSAMEEHMNTSAGTVVAIWDVNDSTVELRSAAAYVSIANINNGTATDPSVYPAFNTSAVHVVGADSSIVYDSFRSRGVTSYAGPHVTADGSGSDSSVSVVNTTIELEVMYLNATTLRPAVYRIGPPKRPEEIGLVALADLPQIGSPTACHMLVRSSAVLTMNATAITTTAPDGAHAFGAHLRSVGPLPSIILDNCAVTVVTGAVAMTGTGLLLIEVAVDRLLLSRIVFNVTAAFAVGIGAHGDALCNSCVFDSVTADFTGFLRATAIHAATLVLTAAGSVTVSNLHMSVNAASQFPLKIDGSPLVQATQHFGVDVTTLRGPGGGSSALLIDNITVDVRSAVLTPDALRRLVADVNGSSMGSWPVPRTEASVAFMSAFIVIWIPTIAAVGSVTMRHITVLGDAYCTHDCGIWFTREITGANDVTLSNASLSFRSGRETGIVAAVLVGEGALTSRRVSVSHVRVSMASCGAAGILLQNPVPTIDRVDLNMSNIEIESSWGPSAADRFVVLTDTWPYWKANNVTACTQPHAAVALAATRSISTNVGDVILSDIRVSLHNASSTMRAVYIQLAGTAAASSDVRLERISANVSGGAPLGISVRSLPAGMSNFDMSSCVIDIQGTEPVPTGATTSRAVEIAGMPTSRFSVHDNVLSCDHQFSTCNGVELTGVVQPTDLSIERNTFPIVSGTAPVAVAFISNVLVSGTLSISGNTFGRIIGFDSAASAVSLGVSTAGSETNVRAGSIAIANNTVFAVVAGREATGIRASVAITADRAILVENNTFRLIKTLGRAPLEDLLKVTSADYAAGAVPLAAAVFTHNVILTVTGREPVVFSGNTMLVVGQGNTTMVSGIYTLALLRTAHVIYRRCNVTVVGRIKTIPALPQQIRAQLSAFIVNVRVDEEVTIEENTIAVSSFFPADEVDRPFVHGSSYDDPVWRSTAADLPAAAGSSWVQNPADVSVFAVGVSLRAFAATVFLRGMVSHVESHLSSSMCTVSAGLPLHLAIDNVAGSVYVMNGKARAFEIVGQPLTITPASVTIANINDVQVESRIERPATKMSADAVWVTMASAGSVLLRNITNVTVRAMSCFNVLSASGKFPSARWAVIDASRSLRIEDVMGVIESSAYATAVELGGINATGHPLQKSWAINMSMVVIAKPWVRPVQPPAPSAVLFYSAETYLSTGLSLGFLDGLSDGLLFDRVNITVEAGANEGVPPGQDVNGGTPIAGMDVPWRNTPQSRCQLAHFIIIQGAYQCGSVIWTSSRLVSVGRVPSAATWGGGSNPRSIAISLTSLPWQLFLGLSNGALFDRVDVDFRIDAPRDAPWDRSVASWLGIFIVSPPPRGQVYHWPPAPGTNVTFSRCVVKLDIGAAPLDSDPASAPSLGFLVTMPFWNSELLNVEPQLRTTWFNLLETSFLVTVRGASSSSALSGSQWRPRVPFVVLSGNELYSTESSAAESHVAASNVPLFARCVGMNDRVLPWLGVPDRGSLNSTLVYPNQTVFDPAVQHDVVSDRRSPVVGHCPDPCTMIPGSAATLRECRTSTPTASRTHTATIGVTPSVSHSVTLPVPAVTDAPTAVLTTTGGIIATGATAAVASVGAVGVAANVGRVTFLAALVECDGGLETGEQLPVQSHPARVALGAEDDPLRYHVGAVVCNVAIPAVAALLWMAAVFLWCVFQQHRDSSSKGPRGFTTSATVLGVTFTDVLSAARLPSLLSVPFMLLVQPTLSSALLVVMKATDPFVRFGASVVLVVLVACFAWAIFALAYAPFPALFADINDSDDDFAEPDAEQFSVVWWRTAFSRFIRPSGEWLDTHQHGSGPERFFVRRHLLLIADYTGRWRWFIVVEVGLNAVLAVIEATATEESCTAAAWVTTVLSFAYVAVVLWCRPHESVFNFYFTLFLGAANAVAALLASVHQHVQDDGLVVTVEVFLRVALYASSLRLAYDIIRVAMHILRRRAMDTGRILRRVAAKTGTWISDRRRHGSADGTDDCGSDDALCEMADLPVATSIDAESSSVVHHDPPSCSDSAAAVKRQAADEVKRRAALRRAALEAIEQRLDEQNTKLLAADREAEHRRHMQSQAASPFDRSLAASPSPSPFKSTPSKLHAHSPGMLPLPAASASVSPSPRLGMSRSHTAEISLDALMHDAERAGVEHSPSYGGAMASTKHFRSFFPTPAQTPEPQSHPSPLDPSSYHSDSVDVDCFELHPSLPPYRPLHD